MDIVTEGELLSNPDAVVWAKAFMSVVESGATVDEGLMTAWFANAFAAEERKHPVARDAQTGEFTTMEDAEARPGETVVEET